MRLKQDSERKMWVGIEGWSRSSVEKRCWVVWECDLKRDSEGRGDDVVVLIFDIIKIKRGVKYRWCIVLAEG